MNVAADEAVDAGEAAPADWVAGIDFEQIERSRFSAYPNKVA